MKEITFYGLRFLFWVLLGLPLFGIGLLIPILNYFVVKYALAIL